MRRSVTALTVLLLLAGRSVANEKEAKATLDRAIQAHGGEAALKKTLQWKRSDKGTQLLAGRKLAIAGQVVRSLPDRVRVKLEVDRKLTLTTVLDGDRGWRSLGGPAEAIAAPSLRELHEETYVWWIATLVPLRGPGFTLAALPETKVDGEPAVGVRVRRTGRAEARLYFHKRNGLLLKIETRGSKAGVVADKEYFYSDYKDFDGIKLPTKEVVKVNGTPETEVTISDYSFPAKLEAGTFGKP